jgi:hypothetical protein
MHQCLTESIHSKNAFQSGIVAEAYNPSYLGSGDRKITVQARSWRHHISTNKLYGVANTCNACYVAGVDRRILV